MGSAKPLAGKYTCGRYATLFGPAPGGVYSAYHLNDSTVPLVIQEIDYTRGVLSRFVPNRHT
jgi:hypothetical protein